MMISYLNRKIDLNKKPENFIGRELLLFLISSRSRFIR
jgi:hypothetical protein